MKTKPVRRGKRKNKRQTATSQSIFDEVSDLKTARKLWADNKRIESANLFLKIVENNPANIPSLIDASRALGELFNYQKSRELLETVVAIGARSASANYLAGQTYRMLRQYQAAENCLARAIELDPKHADARLELAILFERSGRLAEAEEQLLQRKRLLPNDNETVFLLARIQRRNGNQDVAAELLTKLTAGSIHPLTKARCYSELCSLYDQLQEFESAWQAMLAGKNAMKQVTLNQVVARRKRLENYRRLAEVITSEHISRWRGRSQSLPERNTAILTGVPRSGTTLLAKLLHDHPQITSIDEHPAFARFGLPLLLGEQSPETLTLEFLDRLPIAKIASVGGSCTDMMIASLEDDTSSQILINKNPSLLPILIPYIAVFSRSPIMIAIRDPRDILISCLFTYMPVNDFSVDMMSVGEAAERITTDFEIWLNLKKNLSETSWLETYYENLVSDYENECLRVTKFLPMNDAESDKKESNFLVHSPSYEQVAAPVHSTSINRWKNYESFLAGELTPLNSLAERLGY